MWSNFVPVLIVFVLSASGVRHFDVISVVVPSTVALRAALPSMGSVHDGGLWFV